MPQSIPLTKGRYARVSDEDYPHLSQFQWRYIRGYAARTVQRDGKTSLEYMHRRILNAQPGQQVDHRDGDPLNNTRDNLPFATSV